MSRQGKVRLAKWYNTYTQKERAKVAKEITPLILARPAKLCNFIDWKNLKLVYKRYASLYFICAVDPSDNELIMLEIIHEFVEVLDRWDNSIMRANMYKFMSLRMVYPCSVSSIQIACNRDLAPSCLFYMFLIFID
jgi:AP-1 complex subunit sigma 1/2